MSNILDNTSKESQITTNGFKENPLTHKNSKFMKTLFMLLFAVSSLITGIDTTTLAQEDQTIEASFLGIVDGEYHFATTNDKMAFQAIDEKIANVIAFEDKAMQGKKFKVSYTLIEEESEDGEVTEIKTITKFVPLE